MTSLAVLIVEDLESDAQLMVRALKTAGYDVVAERVETAEEMRGALGRRAWDLVISDYSLPQFDGRAALTLLQEVGLDIPFIVVSGTIGEETAVAMMKAGAHDYLLKGNLARLAPAVERELAQAETRRERKRAEEAFAASEKRFRALVENAPDAISLIGPDGTVVYDSPAAPQLLGYETGELLGRNAFALINPDDLPHVTPLFQQVLQDPAARVNSIFRFRHKDGSWRWIEATASNLLAEPSVQAVVINYRDITERKQAEVALRESERQMQALVTSLDDIVFEFDEQGTYLNVWAADERLLARPSTEMIRLRIADVLGEEGGRPFVQSVNRVLTSGRPENIEYPLDVANGRRWFLARISPILAADGTYRTASMLVRDITERKQAEAALATSEAELHALFASMRDVVLVIDREGIYRKIAPTNPAFWYIPPQELLGKRLRDVFPAEQSEVFYGVIQQVLDTKRNTQVEYELIFGGQTIWYEASVSRLSADSTLWVARDITERKQAEEALQKEKERAQQYLDVAGVIFLVLAADRKVILINKKGCEILGYVEQEIVGRNWVDNFLPQGERGRAGAAIDQLMAGEIQPVEYFENPVLTISGQERLVAWHNSLLTDEAGRIIGVVSSGEDITERRRAEESLRQRFAELEALHTVSTALRIAQTRDEALPILLDETLAALETNAGVIWLYHPERNELRIAVARGWFRQLADNPLRPGEGIAGTVFASGQARISPEFAHDPLILDSARGPQIPAGWGGACLPIRSSLGSVGVLFIGLPLPRQITAAQIRLLESLAEMASAALHRMRLHEETVRRADQLEALHNIDLAITASLDLRMTLNVLLEQVTRQLNVDATCILLLNPHMQTLEYSAGRGFQTSVAQTTRIRLGESFAGRAALERHTVQVVEPAQIHQSPHFAALWAGEGFAAYFGVPLIAKGEVKGVLEVFHRSPLAPEPDWLSFLETLGGQAAIAIDNAQLFDNLQRSNVDLTLAYDATIEGWSRALDLRDKETEGHTLRVTEMTERLAKAVGLPVDEFVHIRRGALLHDIGKMGVPDAILLKPGPLTDEEWVVMKKHPVYAHEMLAPIAYLKPALDIPYCHHEKWDGTGYPRGLKGEQVPLAARLFAVVDVWDALRSDRTYRPGWPEEKVVEHIKAASGSHFDPKVAQAFLNVIG